MTSEAEGSAIARSSGGLLGHSPDQAGVVRVAVRPGEHGLLDEHRVVEGQYVGSYATGEMEMPSSFGSDGLTAYLETDEFDVPTIVVRRLPPVAN